MKKSSSTASDLKSKLAQLEDKLNVYFAKNAPELPKGVKEFIVWVSPYAAILEVVLAIPAILAALGFGAIVFPALLLTGGLGLRGILMLAATILTIVLAAMAVPALFKKQKTGWDKLFLISLISVATALINMNILSLIVGTAISWYFLFQVRSYYK